MRGKPGGWGRGVACTWPLSAAQTERAGLDPRQAEKSGGGGEVCLLSRSLGAHKKINPHNPRRRGAP